MGEQRGGPQKVETIFFKIVCQLHMMFIKVDINFRNSFQIIYFLKKKTFLNTQ